MPKSPLDEKIKLGSRIQELAWQKIRRIDAFDFQWENSGLVKSDQILKELRQLATIASIGSSTRIEGSALSDEEVKNLIENLDISKLQSRDEEEVVGYYESLELIFENYESVFLSEAYIKQLHNTLMQFSSKDTKHRGEYKSLSNKVVAKYPGSISKVIFDTTEPFLVAKEMNELVAWTSSKLEDSNFHKLIVIAVFVYEFLSIHPFQDGNGRLSRVLTNLLLMRAGYSFVKYISLEHIVEERKKDYYKVLMEGQKNRGSECEIEDVSLWVIFFLESIEVVIERLKAKVKVLETCDLHGIQQASLQINDRQEKILDYVRENETARISQLMELFEGTSRATISNDLSFLVDSNLLFQHGRGRGTFYKVI